MSAAELKARIFDIQQFSLHDGPGIRTTIFFKGCNLSCAWCHNPEGLTEKLQEDAGHTKTYGKDISCEELLKEVRKDKKFYENSNGGITCSGGECLLQADFLSGFLKECKAEGIHTAVETAGNIAWKAFERVMPHTDLFLYDLKVLSEEKHKQYTGVSNRLIQDNLVKLIAAGQRLWVRIPVIREVNGNAAEMEDMAEFLRKQGFQGRIDLLGYHTYGRQKYKELYGSEQALFSPPSIAQMEQFAGIFSGVTGDIHYFI
jgi:pyruvate formate lyase activating enzyme